MNQIQPRASETRARLDEEAKWAAVTARAGSFDGVFYYSVASTGVYCRPSCPARRAKRNNVRFHDTRADAETAGFRPCLRCKPDQPSLAERNAAKVADACRLIEAADEPPSLGVVAEAVGLSPHHFHRMFKAALGVTPKAYAVAHRNRRVRDQLERRRTVTEAIHASGFNSSGRFYANSSQVLGMTPKTFRAGGDRAAIRFALGECSLGSILVAQSQKGICAILIGDHPDALIRDLEGRFKRATLIGGNQGFERIVAAVVGHVEAPRIGLDLPLDIRGTAFQHRVWTALCEIAPGATASYAEIAERIGAPKAVRAVASACAANPLAVAIPCHRVVRRGGGLSGYHWGIERKRTLLEREAKA